MSIEQCLYVRLEGDVAKQARDLQRRADAARERAQYAGIGDREEIVRFEQACAQLEGLGMAQLAATGRAAYVEGPGADDAQLVYADHDVPVALPPQTWNTVARWLYDGAVVVQLQPALEPGPTPQPLPQPSLPVADIWRPRGNRAGLAAVLDHFTQQLEAVCGTAQQPADPSAVLRPSGVSNKALTEGLRAFAVSKPGFPTVSAPVIYADNSSAADFPLRGLPLTPKPLPQLALDERCFRFALMSIRHMEMDARVHGAWFRNSDVSRNRPRADSDEFAYRESAKQITELCRRSGAVRIEMYQTGFEPAVLGFYRAVADQLRVAPRSLQVVPHFFVSEDKKYPAGEPWWVEA